ncbi:MAG: YggS family pyridoxal phosphate-dependent enzyme, partial [Pseudorhodobacter sp.]|nr:YggS family pyridoxal phosphate-dependent enzyme [Rhizobacter sp.]
MSTIALQLQQVHARVAQACTAAGRDPSKVTLLCVSKTQPPDAVREAFAAGERSFGENYVQEGVDKIATLADLRSRIAWHLIGPLQSNKTRVVAEHFDWVHSVDRLKIAQRLSEQRPEHLAPLQICLQVNISGEASKSGLLPGDVAEVAKAVSLLPRLQLRGLMSIPEPANTEAGQRPPRGGAGGLFEAPVAKRPPVAPSKMAATLSAGMPMDKVSSGKPFAISTLNSSRSATCGARCAASVSAGSGMDIKPRNCRRGSSD